MNLAPQPRVNYRRMHAGEPFPLVRNLNQEDAIAQQFVQVLLVDALAGPGLTLLRRPGLGGNPLHRQVGGDLRR